MTSQRSMSEAETRYVDAVTEDCRQILGAGMEVLDVVVEERGSTASMTVSYRLDGWQGASTGFGETVVAAHAALREALVVDRIKLGFAVVTDPRTLQVD